MKRKIVLLFFVFLIYSCGNEYSTQNENLASIKTNPYFSVVTPSGNEGLTESEQNKIMQGLPISKSFDIYNGIFVKNYFKDVIKPELLNKINITDKILLLNSYSQNGVVKLKDGSAELPVGDGVVDLNVNEYVSQKLTDKDVLTSDTELYNTIVIIGEKIEISDNFYTNGKNIWIIANEVIFKDSGNGIAGKIITTPQKINIIKCEYKTTPGTEGYEFEPKNCDINGKKGLNGGDVFIGTNVLTGIPRIEANGLNGHNGTSALQAVFKGHSPQYTNHKEYLNEPTSLFYDYKDDFDNDINYYKSHAANYIGSEIILGNGGSKCNYLVSNDITEFLHPDKKVSTAGGNGGNGGKGGDIYIFYNYLAPNLTLKSDGTLDNTFATSEINIISEKKCFDYSCSFEECAVIECNIDCTTNNCSENECVQTKCDEIKKCKEAYVSVCNGDKYTKGFENLLFNENTTGIEEATNGTCSDGIDNDLDGLIDCDDKECFYSPFVTVCSTENSLEKCSDGIDNDNDGLIDCNDPNCKNNPYVLKCEYHVFLRESTNTTCRDGINNDNDAMITANDPNFSFPYIDCDDFGCQNNPFVTHCKCPNTTTWSEYDFLNMSPFVLKECENNMNEVIPIDFENSIEECTDGVDNDDDGKVDCGDPHCSLNYFFGKRLCSNKIQTNNIKSIDNKIQNYFDIQNNGGKGGTRGYSSKPLLLKIYETLKEICLPGDVNPVCIWVTDKSVYEVCLPKINETNNGVDGEKGTATFQKWNIKDLHKVMLGVSPQRFSVLNMFGDTSYKKADKKAASFYYSYVIKNLATLFSDFAITNMCSNNSDYTIQQYQICSLYKNARLNFTKNAANINYYKTLELQSINPTIKLTGESGIINKFFYYTDELDRITNFINLYQKFSIRIFRKLKKSKTQIKISIKNH